MKLVSNTDTGGEGEIESVRINGVPELNGLNLEKNVKAGYKENSPQ